MTSFFILITSLLNSQALASDLQVTVSNLRSNNGILICKIFLEEGDFPAGVSGKINVIKTKINNNSAICNFKNLKKDNVAVSVMHDEDANGEMRSNWFGYPLEGWGVSNNAPQKTFGPPHFKECVVDVNKSPKTSIIMRY